MDIDYRIIDRVITDDFDKMCQHLRHNAYIVTKEEIKMGAFAHNAGMGGYINPFLGKIFVHLRVMA
jgi:hypothetical protein